MTYLRNDELLYDINEASDAESPVPHDGGAGATVNRKDSPTFVVPASPREALREFPRRVDALVHSIVAHAIGEHFQLMEKRVDKKIYVNSVRTRLVFFSCLSNQHLRFSLILSGADLYTLMTRRA